MSLQSLPTSLPATRIAGGVIPGQRVFRVTNVKTNTPSGGGIQDPTNGERFFELATQVSDCSHYDEIEKSCDSGPEHSIAYVNEAVSEATDDGDQGIPQYENLSMLGLSLKSGPQLTNIDNQGFGLTVAFRWIV